CSTARRGSPTATAASRWTRARRSRAPARPASVLLEERQVGARPHDHRARRARVLGGLRLPQPRRPLEGAALLERLSWRHAAIAEVRSETAHAKTLVLDVDGWPGHRAGQHVDIRVTAEDGYQAQRSYSIASAPESPRLELTVERVEDGEVSTYLV